MASNNLWTIIRAIQHGGEITPRQVRRLLGCDSKKACRLLEHLVAAGAVKNIGQRRHPVYVMEPGGEARIKPMPGARQKTSIADVCRQSPAAQRVLMVWGRASA